VPKRITAYTLALPPRDSETPAYLWLCAALRAEILEGRLGPGARLPATRDLAAEYGLSRGTIVAGYAQLEAEGYVRGSTGSGTYVSDTIPDDLLRVRGGGRGARSVGEDAAAPRRARHRLSAAGRRVEPFPDAGPRATRAFRANEPALDLFPAALWAQVAGRRLRRVSTELLRGCPAEGYPPLREAVADYLRAARGVRCTAEQVLILSGVQEALDLTSRLFLDGASRACVEDPGYWGAALAFSSVGARISTVRVDDEGMMVPPRRLSAARVVYLTPAHQFPLGMTMSLPRRLALLDWAHASDAVIFEDDYDSEYRYRGHPIPALQGLDERGLVLFAGSFSKVLFPSLRLGYLVVPPDLVERFAAAVSIGTRHAPLMEQAILCDFIVEGHFGRHLRRMREVYAGRLGALLEGAHRELAGLLEIIGVEAGLQVAGWLADGFDDAAVARAAARRRVEVVPLSAYSRRRMRRQGLQLGFAAVDEGEIGRGITELARTLEAIRR